MDWSSGYLGGPKGAPLSWKKLEKVLSGKPTAPLVPVDHIPARGSAGAGVGGDRGNIRINANRPYCELHAAGSYHFLRGASEPEDMVAAAQACGHVGLALLDRDGFYGAVAFAEAAIGNDATHSNPQGDSPDNGAQETSASMHDVAHAGIPCAPTNAIKTIFGAELTLEAGILPVLCRGPEGYRRLSRAISAARMASGEKDRALYPPLEQLAAAADGTWLVLADHTWLPHLDELCEAFGTNVVLEYVLAQDPLDADHFDDLDAARAKHGIRAIVTTRATSATKQGSHLAAAKQALALQQSLADANPELPPMPSWLRPGELIARQLGHRDYLVDATVDIAEECAFELSLVVPKLPNWDVPEGYSEQTWLEHLVWQRFDVRYHSRSKEVTAKARAQAEHELAVIDKLGFPGYFLIVDDIVGFAKKANILCQGRGSAANSVVCFVLGITNAEPISAGLLFERFLSPEREGAPDIDLDIESGRREEVIQYVYGRYGRENAAQVANVITYRTKGAIRDAARALGYPQGAADGWSKGLDEPPSAVTELATEFLGQPRHLGIHSGGMVICDRPIAEVVPTEWARMENRSVVQWDKEGCASAGLVKFDLLGLGMLEALHHMIDLVAETGTTVNLWELDMGEPAVYEMLSKGDAIGVFQVESRAQLNTLPRLKPTCFYDLVIEVALIRPGPIQGGSVHPYLRRRDGKEEITFEHPVLEKPLAKTLGVPLFQEQLMQIAVDAAGFSGGEADELRRAMGSKRSARKMAALRERFYAGLRSNDIEGQVADALWNKIVAFAAYGFPESHSQSFASLVFFSAWFKLHYPAQFCVGLLRAQPMGFYSPQSLLADARRHGVEVLPIDVNVSQVEATIENGAIRLGLNLVKGLGNLEAIVEGQPYTDIGDLARRAGLSVNHVEALARAGALECFGVDRRQALWQAGVAATEHANMLPGLSVVKAPTLPGMNAFELMVTDIAATGVTHDTHPMARLRAGLRGRGILTGAELREVPDGSRVYVAGVVTHRQRPATASGVTFFGMEDETGLINIVVSVGLWNRQKKLARTAKSLLVRGIVRNANGVAQVEADRLDPLPIAKWLAQGTSQGSRDFR
ncbi:error-prone DNA polymerase [Corynebacterium sp. SCR221107]|uniref:error-prone DNA polymerase n=1 Tax=Corynebacterium sp. SCR221107 TaxID=3017361 RepID=UPI0022EC8067|nr:error-prone DNA polymerase [Corynebacterium sp. SCR221107]WBT09291.1 error-prone DNA polymerase [Corynebacterium sp. SCR221107]